MVTETWEKITDFGKDFATVIYKEDGSFFCDLGCVLWNREYKRYRYAEQYMLKCGYKAKEVVIHL